MKKEALGVDPSWKVDVMNKYVIPTIASIHKLKKPKLSPLLPDQPEKSPLLGSKFGDMTKT